MEAEQPKMYFQAIILILNTADLAKTCLLFLKQQKYRYSKPHSQHNYGF